MNILLVVARNENKLEWLSRVNHPYKIYNKGKNDLTMASSTISNIGSNGHSFIYHIYEYYNKLSDINIFCDENPHSIYGYFVDAVNQMPFSINKLFKFSDGCYGMSDAILGEDSEYIKKSNNNAKDFYDQYFSLSNNFFQYAKGGQYVVYKQNIQNKPRDWYKKILLDTDWNGSGEQAIERNWPMIFDRNNRYKCQWSSKEIE